MGTFGAHVVLDLETKQLNSRPKKRVRSRKTKNKSILSKCLAAKQAKSPDGENAGVDT